MRSLRTLGLTILLVLAACNTSRPSLPATAPAPRQAPGTVTPPPSPRPTPAPSPEPAGWVEAVPGLERRVMRVPFPELSLEERVVAFRIDPALHGLRVLYTPGVPRLVSEWAPDAALVFNANFFDTADRALGLVVSDGLAFGASYDGYGGMLAVDAAGQARVRSLAAQPYRPEERPAQAVQGFPMLIYPDGSTFGREDGIRARRTAVGQDTHGRLVMVVAPHAAFTLAGLAAWLSQSDLELALAFNLDGGGSTGYRAGPNDHIDSYTQVPAVVAIYPR